MAKRLDNGPAVIANIAQGTKDRGPGHLATADDATVIFAGMKMFEVTAGVADSSGATLLFDVHMKGVKQ